MDFFQKKNGLTATVFKDSFKKQFQKGKNKHRTESCGQSFLNEDFADGKHVVKNIRSGKCEEGDMTLLCSLLMYTSGYIKDKPDVNQAAEA